MKILKRAICYVRVSSDEQAKGYSPADQKDKLIKYCEDNQIEVVGLYFEDESGKTFDRPEWIKIMKFIRETPNKVELFLFVKWDRFSRNVAEAYIAIKQLKKYGVEPQALEQPLNFEIPESKIMLAIYLAAPEVDNDRRALNIFNGIRKGKKEGRWLGACLKGFKNTRDENNRPIIKPEGGEKEKLVRKAFTQFATGLFNIEELRRNLNKEGLKCARNSFWELLRNKGYIGQVFVPAYKDEPAQWIKGNHPPLIDEKTFYTVQEILDDRRKKVPNKYQTVRDEFPLRGFLACPQCNKTMTASASKGKMGTLFYYYHCHHGCKERKKAKDVNQSFIELLKGIKANPQVMTLQAAILKNKIKKKVQHSKSRLKEIEIEVSKLNQRLKNARILMLDGEISSNEYKEMKNEIEELLMKFSSQASALQEGYNNFDSTIYSCLNLLENLDFYYASKNTEIKQKIVSSIFQEKLVFENNKYRTPVLNKAIELICRKNAAFEGKMEKKHTEKYAPSCRVESADIFSNSILNDFKVLSDLNAYLSNI